MIDYVERIAGFKHPLGDRTIGFGLDAPWPRLDLRRDRMGSDRFEPPHTPKDQAQGRISCSRIRSDQRIGWTKKSMPSYSGVAHQAYPSTPGRNCINYFISLGSVSPCIT